MFKFKNKIFSLKFIVYFFPIFKTLKKKLENILNLIKKFILFLRQIFKTIQNLLYIFLN